MLQVLINKALKLDASLQPHLLALNGKSIAVFCNDFPSLNTYCTFDHAQVLFNSSAPEQADLIIRGSLRGLLHFAVSKQRSELQIQGDTSVAQLVEKLYLELNIDWEEELSKITGDVIAYQALYTLRSLRDYTVNTRDSLATMITEYLQEESDLLPTSFEVEAFMEDVDDLRLRVDRLEARITAHESN